MNRTIYDARERFGYLTNAQAERMGFSRDRRRRRGQHRRAARNLARQDTRGSSILRAVVAWHLQQARRPRPRYSTA